MIADNLEAEFPYGITQRRWQAVFGKINRCELHRYSIAIGFPKIMMLTVLFILVALWCWFGRGPYFLRWPAVLLTILLTSGHPLGGILGGMFDGLAEPLLVLFFLILGFSMMLRGLFGQSHRRHRGFGHLPHGHHHHRNYRRRGWYDRW